MQDNDTKILLVSKEDLDNITERDREGDLVLLHYTHSAESDAQIISRVGHVRGTIVDNSSKQIVCQSLPYTPEISVKDVASYVSNDLSTALCYKACEGTIMRLFFYSGEWKLSTHKKINAINSFWSGSSFAHLFNEAKWFDLADLNKDWSYIFLLSHNSNRLIYYIPKPKLMLVGIFDKNQNRLLRRGEWGAPIEQVLEPESIEGIKSRDSLVNYLDSLEGKESFDNIGVILYPSADSNAPLKIVTKNYERLRKIRGNVPDFWQRYLELRGTFDAHELEEMYEKDGDPTIDKIHRALVRLTNRIYNYYVNRFIRKDFSNIPKEEFVTIQRCHQWYLGEKSKTTSGERVSVTKEKVAEILNDTPPYYLYLMLKRQRDK